MKKIYRWKFITKDLKSQSGDTQWKINKWNKIEGDLEMCKNGFHASIEPYDAFSYIQDEVLVKVECQGKHLSDDNKECWTEMRVVKAYKWTKCDSLKLAIFSAELVLHNFEKEYPDDKRPREAIEAAKKVLFKDTAKNRSAAWSAARSAESAAESAARSAAWSAARSAAWSAAESAAWSAESAARSAAWSAGSAAESAARSAAESARSAAWLAARSAAESARSAAWSAARSAAIKKIQTYFNKLVKDLKSI